MARMEIRGFDELNYSYPKLTPSKRGCMAGGANPTRAEIENIEALEDKLDT